MTIIKIITGGSVMRAKVIFYPLAIILIIILSGSIYGRESYEDYMDKKNKEQL